MVQRVQSMEQPQDPSAKKRLLAAQQDFQEQVMREEQEISGEMLRATEDRMQAYLAVKQDIDGQMMHIQEKLQSLRQTVDSNVRNEENPLGVLKHDRETYLDCLKIDHVKLEELLQKDEAGYAENMREAQQVKEQVKDILAEQALKLEALFARTIGAQPKFSMKMTLMWRYKCTEEDVNFDWPPQDLFDSLAPDVYVKSISFKAWHPHGAMLSSVQVVLSNGIASPNFEADELNHGRKKTFNISPEAPVKKIQVQQHCLKCPTFYDRKGEELFNHLGRAGEDEPLVELADNEELIGVFGVRKWGQDPDSDFIGLGFKLRVRHQ